MGGKCTWGDRKKKKRLGSEKSLFEMLGEKGDAVCHTGEKEKPRLRGKGSRTEPRLPLDV